MAVFVEAERNLGVAEQRSAQESGAMEDPAPDTNRQHSVMIIVTDNNTLRRAAAKRETKEEEGDRRQERLCCSEESSDDNGCNADNSVAAFSIPSPPHRNGILTTEFVNGMSECDTADQELARVFSKKEMIIDMPREHEQWDNRTTDHSRLRRSKLAMLSRKTSLPVMPVMTYLKVPNGNQQLDNDDEWEDNRADSGVTSLGPDDLDERGIYSPSNQPFDRHPERRRHRLQRSPVMDESPEGSSVAILDRSFSSRGTGSSGSYGNSRTFQKRRLQAVCSAPASPIPGNGVSPGLNKKSLFHRLGGSLVSEKGMRFAKKLYRSVSSPLEADVSESKGGGMEISFPTKRKNSKSVQKYRVIAARTGQPDAISFEVIGKVECYLRSQGNELSPEKDGGDSYFNKDCTFVPLQDMWFPGYFAFESASKPSYFIRMAADEGLLRLDKFDGTDDFKEESSFLMKKRPCATCLQVGVRSWAKLPSGEYSLGRVTAIGNTIEVTLDDNRKLQFDRLSTCNQLIPDVIPLHSDLPLGTRVLAQWLSRETLYPGIITGIHGDEFEVEYDDGDSGKEKTFQIRLLRSYSFREDIHDDNESMSEVDVKERPHNDPPRSEVSVAAEQHVHSVNERPSHNGSTPATVGEGHPSLEPITRQHRFLSRSPTVTQPSQASSTSPDALRTASTSSSGSSHGNEVIENNVKLSPHELETLSQDSGYHGYQKMMERAHSFHRRKVSVPLDGLASSAVKKYSFELRGCCHTSPLAEQDIRRPSDSNGTTFRRRQSSEETAI